jgi:DNA-binding transcriptional MerR regulator
MKIGELARRAGLNASAIRYYEQRGLLRAPHRSNGQRRYPTDALDRVLPIRFASDMGFTLDEIKLFSMACAMKPQSDHGGNDWPIGRFTKWRRTSAVRGGLNRSVNIFCSAAVRHSRSVSRALVSALAYAA